MVTLTTILKPSPLDSEDELASDRISRSGKSIISRPPCVSLSPCLHDARVWRPESAAAPIALVTYRPLSLMQIAVYRIGDRLLGVYDR